MKYVFLDNLHHAYAQTDGSYDFPNSREGDMLKQAKKEIEEKDKLLSEKDKQIAELQSDSVNVRGAMKAKDKLIAEQEKALTICESEYRKADKLLAECRKLFTDIYDDDDCPPYMVRWVQGILKKLPEGD